MKRVSLFVCLLLALSVSVANAGGIPSTYEECTQVLQDAEMAGEKVTSAQVSRVVSAVNKQCLSGAETSEFLNEVLFAVLRARPADFLVDFANANPESRKRILHELENPISDAIDLQKSYDSVSGVKGSDDAGKQAILSALNVAAEKMDLHFQ